jgi:lipopolysaccharide transport system ATP-binding protein
VSPPVILLDGIGKKFCRSVSAGLLYGLQDFIRNGLRLAPLERLRKDEFWALREVSFKVDAGECVGIIGPNGAGKSTLLRLVNREYPPDRGRVIARGRIQSLIRLGSGLQPLLTGRENIYIQCAQLGLGKRETDAKLDEIVAFAGLEKALDGPVKHYSDGMYARLEFSITTCIPHDILLIDEVLAVGDIAFQLRCLERLDRLKREGAAILFVSHSEMNIRQIADRCLLLFDGEALALGETESLFLKYYEAVGYRNRPLKPLGLAPEMPKDFDGGAAVRRLTVAGQERAEPPRVRAGQPLTLMVDCGGGLKVEQAELVLQFWSSAGLLLASLDSAANGLGLSLPAGRSRWRVSLPFLSLTAGIYRVAGGVRAEGRWLGYRSELLRLVVQDDRAAYRGWVSLPAEIVPEPIPALPGKA